ncbi:MAG TPA: outer membrane protein [Hyphomicrobiaceae bacterium]|nr:outer membrane protein [Hyphomicrobiaceae bacterium]
MRAQRAVALAIAIGAVAPCLTDAATAADLGRPGRIASVQPIETLPSPFTWAGLYVGAHAGYGWSTIDWDEGAFMGSQDGEGWLAGGQVGFNLQMGRLVYGLEADLSKGWVDGGEAGSGHSLDWLYSVRGRLGLASYDNRWLFYATGGAAWADFDYSSAGLPGTSDTQFGWVAGAGVERALTPNLTARVEYLYYDFDSLNVPAGVLGPATELDPSMHTVRFGLNLKF